MNIGRYIHFSDTYTSKNDSSTYPLDYYVLAYNEKKAKKRIDNKQYKPLLNESYFKTFEYLPDIDDGCEPVGIQELVKVTNLSASFLKYKILRELKKDKYIVETSNGYYYKVNGWLPLAKDIIAIEAKLKDWKRGFYQANRYKAFADRVYLALPSNTIHLVNKDLLKKHNVGLISFDPETSIKKHILEPRRTNALNENKRSFASEFFWKRSYARTLV